MKSGLAVMDKVCCVSTRADQKFRMKAVGLAVIRMKAVVLEMVYWMSSCVYRSRGGGLMHTCMQALVIYRIRLNNHRIKDFIIGIGIMCTRAHCARDKNYYKTGTLSPLSKSIGVFNPELL